MPSAPLVVVRTNPMVKFRNSTFTPETAALLESVTVPTRLPVVVWANTQAHKSAGRASASPIRFPLISETSRLFEIPTSSAPCNGSSGSDRYRSQPRADSLPPLGDHAYPPWVSQTQSTKDIRFGSLPDSVNCTFNLRLLQAFIFLCQRQVEMSPYE